ncbi:phosphate regulon sensor histidine kinase PhoR [Aquincola sp. S2]|uniref:Phosphate regulon sensor protein PhoR n=1 Tax=Pseudaquabacterium terrae TaxID=2732868 RepID=A0ABX2EHK8_9BURK|nr:phosphate regulon sensor histidine kinase PhoR [Aquabacterium terrae]NRF68118.1 phosphate regulon sensor histidine kinase PhoR [Aquabacterium terrae]
MDRLPLRTLGACAALLVGLVVGPTFASGPAAWLLTLSVTAALALLSWLLLDWWSLRKLARWVAAGDGRDAPRGAGPVGELGYRIERAMRALGAITQAEQRRLAQFLQAIEASPNGVLLLDAQDHIQWLNHVAAQHFGLDGLRDREQRITNLVRAPAFVEHLQSGDIDEPVSFPSPHGEALLQVLVRRYGEDSKLVLSQDITERERSDTMRRDFVANVSHEIRSPLTVLSGFVETLSTLPLTEVERERVLTLMRQQTQRMQNLVTDLLALARIEGAPRPPADAWVDVAALLQHVENDARASDHGQHQLSVDADGGGAAVNGDESELFSAVWNLCSNALRYTPAGGSVRVAYVRRADGGAEFSVSDSGVGIAKEHIPRLTERFYRVDSSRSRETGGTGLGLAIVKHVVQRHGGTLQVDSQPGKGSTFRIVLPAHRVRDAQPLPAPATVVS